MTGKTSVGPHAKGLLSSLSDHGVRHLDEVESDLRQTNILLAEAIDKLARSFIALHQSVADQQAAVSRLVAGDSAPADTVTLLAAQQEEITRHVNAAMTGLQFQDMTSQLIDRTARRVGGLRDLLNDVGAATAAMPSDADGGALIAGLAGMQALMKEQSTLLEAQLWKAVRQTHMESGDIELF